MADLGKITKIALPSGDTVSFYENSVYISTAAGTAAKVGTISAYTPRPGWLQVMNINSNTAASALTLNINSAGAKPIYINGTASSTTNYTLPAGVYLVNYDGTNYYFWTNSNLSLKNDSAADTYIKLSNNVGEIWFNVGPTGNRGIRDATMNKWLIYNPSNSDSTRIPGWANIGSSIAPVYFNASGIPIACDKLENPSAITGMTQLTVSQRIFVGSTAPSSINVSNMQAGDLYIYVP